MQKKREDEEGKKRKEIKNYIRFSFFFGNKTKKIQTIDNFNYIAALIYCFSKR